MHRVRSTDVWFNAPGVVAAYQPIAAPDPLAARQNVGSNGRMAGRHTAQPGVLPTHDPRTGWVYTGSQYLNTALVPVMDTKWSMLVRFDYASGGTYPTVAGCRQSAVGGVEDFVISADDGPTGTANISIARNGKGNTGYSFSPRVEGVVGFAGLTAYHNGVASGAVSSAACTNTQPIFIGTMNNQGSPQYYFIGTIQAFLVVSRTLSVTEAWAASRQMAYCHVNPDWNAWGRRRQYFYAPAQAAGFLAAWAAHSNSQIGTGTGI